MSYTTTAGFRAVCRLILFCFTFATFHPATLGVPWKIDISFDTQTWNLQLGTWNWEFGPTPAYGQAADLAPTPDANSADPFVIQKAQELGNDPAQIFAFVRDQIGYESYKGSLRGARGTLWSKAGNALDQASLLIALLRASNIPARYVRGTLSDALAQQLILSMFPAPLRVVGCINPGTEVSDPANDPKLLAETREHYWVQFGSSFQDADPTFASAQVGQAFTAAQGTFSEVPDNLRHKVIVRLNRELTSPGANLLTGGTASSDVTPVLDQTFSTAELVGKPLSIGHFVNSVPLGTPIFTSITNTYSPYIAVGDFASQIRQDKLLRGTDYQEVLTNFPFGSSILTGLFLEIDVTDPDGPTETFKRTLVDLIGFDVRTNGGSPNITFDPNGPPTLTDLDIFTINILTGLLLPNLGRPLANDLTTLQTDIKALQNDDGTFPLEASDELREFIIGVTRLNAANYFTLSDFNTTRVANSLLVQAYSDRPRIVISSITVEKGNNNDTAALVMRLDLRSNNVRAVAYPGQNTTAVPTFNMTRGFGENAIETSVIESQPAEDGNIISTATVFAAAAAQKITPLIIGPENLSQIVALDASAEAKARMTQAVENGLVVIVPSRSVVVGQTLTIAWYEADPGTGNIIGVTEDGGHQALSEHVAFITATSFLVGALQGFATAFGPLAFNDDCSSSTQAREKCKNDIRTNLAIGAEAGAVIATISFAVSLGSFIGLGGPVPFIASLLGKAIAASLVLDALDPPVSDFLISPESPLDALSNLSGTNVVAEVIPDSLFTLPFGGAQLPTVFRAGIKNTGATVETFILDFTDVPTGFTAQTSVPQITVPPGQTAEVGICLRPTSGVPAPGTPAPFTLNVTSTTNGAISTSATESFTVSEIHGVTLESAPPAVSTTPGVPVNATLVLKSVGNVPETVTLSTNLSPGLSANNLGSVSLAIEEVATRTLTLTPSAGTPLNSTLTASITANFGTPEGQTIAVPVRVAVPGADAIADASVAAGQLGKPSLAQRLNDLSIALTNLTQNPGSEVFKSQALANLDSVISLLANDPALSFFVGDLTSARNALAAANTSGDIQTAIRSLGTTLDTLATAATDLVLHNFEAFLSPNTQVAQPQTPMTFELRLHNIGALTTTYNLSLNNFPPGVTGQLSQTSVILDRDAFASIDVTLTQTSATELLAFNFAVKISPTEAPSISRTVQGALTVRNEFVSVVAVSATPPFVDPGGQVNVSARLLNAVNMEQAALISYIVKDPNGQTVFTSQPVQTTLSVQTSLTTVNLGALNTTNFALGDYAIMVSVTKPNGTPIPGATGEGTLLIGSPVTASIAVEPDTLPPGDGVVTNRLQVTGANVGDPLTIVGHLPIEQFKQIFNADANDFLNGLALNLDQERLYVFGNNGFHVVNVADVAQPLYVRNKAFQGFTSGIVDGNRLIVMSPGPLTNVVANARGVLDYIDLGGTFGTADDPGRIQGTTFPYQFAGMGVLVNAHLFVPTLQVRFDPANNDIFSQNGTVLSFSVDPTRVSTTGIFVLEDVLLNENGTTNDATFFENGGNFNIFSVAVANPQTLLAASTTATGTNTQTGVGRILVVDIADPNDINSDPPNTSKIVGELQIPGTVQVHGLALDGNLAFAVATQGGWRDPFVDLSDIGPTGNLVVATINIADPRNPQLIHSEVIPRSARGGGDNLIALGNHRFAFSSLGQSDPADTPQLFIVDASNPNDIVMNEQLDLPGHVRGLKTDGAFLYTVGDDGLTIYRLSGANVPVTARVQIPKNTGVTVDLNSFSIPPTNINNDTNFDTLVWDFTGSQTVTWESTITNLQPGESREVTRNTTIDFTFQGTPGQITLPPTFVTSQHIVSIDPTTRTVQPGEAAPYTLTVKNPTNAQVTYDLSVQGVSPAWVDLIPSVSVPANSESTVVLRLTSDLFAQQGEYGFVVTASANTGATGSVQVSFVLEGEPTIPAADPQAHGVVIELTPSQGTAGQGTAANFIVRVANTGSETDTIVLTHALPAGVTGVFEQTSIEVPPGASNFREVALTLTPQPGTTPGSSPFTVGAVSTTDPDQSDTDDGTLVVVSAGVDVDITPASGAPGSVFQMTVRNTGQGQETFDLTLAGPAGLVSTLGVAEVTLAAGASQVVNISASNISFASPGSLELTGVATARSNTAVKDSDTVQVTIASSRDMTAEFVPPGVNLPTPGNTSSLLQVHNTGNTEDAYKATITGMTGDVTTSLTGLDGQPTQEVPLFRLPGLSTGVIVLNTQKNAGGTGTVTVTVMSVDGAISDAATFTVQVGDGGPTNQPPVADAGDDRNVAVGQAVELDGSDSFDPEGSLIIYAWSVVSVPTGSQVTTDTLTDKDKPKPAFTPDMAGKYVFRLIVNDGQVDSAPDEVELTAAIANVPPNADAGADQTALVGVTVIVNGNSSTDPDNGPQLLTFAWTFVQVPVGSTRTTADISGASQPQASFVPDVQGTYILRLTVSDGPASDTDDVEIVVTVQNVPPIANAGGDQTVTRGTEVTLDGRGSSDPDNGPQPLAYSWRLVSKPSGSQLTDADIIGSETATPKLLPDVTGSYVVELEVFDGAASAFDNVVVEVRQSAQCPLSQGYWKNHSAVWPVTALQLGAQTYSKAELLSLLRNPSTGDASLILARQLIAAKLNIAAGSDSTPVSATITDADQHLNAFTGKLPYKVKTSSTTGQTMVDAAGQLESYNNGKLTPQCERRPD